MTDKTNSKVSEFIYEPKSAWNSCDKEKVMQFCEGYKEFLNNSKTEIEAVKNIVSAAKKEGYVDISTVKKIKQGDRLFSVNRDRCVSLILVGSKPVSLGVNIVVSHLDSPRLDLKPKPLYEDAEVALLKTHYYGGIKKYQWLNYPLSLHGYVMLKDKKRIELNYGEKDNEACFVIPDLLPHLSKSQNDKKATELVVGEQLSAIVGSIPVNDEESKAKIKENVLSILNNKYKIKEKDFFSADLCFVPKVKANDVGFDSSFVGSYGQDDKGCAYLSLKAFLDSKPKFTSVVMFFDKEEIGSDGNTGAHSRYVELLMEKIISLSDEKVSPLAVFEKSKVISADVTVAFDPLFKEVHDEKNAAKMGFGVAIEKYTGSGGKYYASQATSDYCRFVIDLCEKNNISYQFDELGKVDEGGGGTVARYFAQYGCDVLDCGFPVLGMHSPYELSSKVDLYNAYLLYKVFFDSENNL